MAFNEQQYLETFLEPILKCKEYKPKFGNSQRKKGYEYSDFKKLYSSDPFYAWLGLDNELMYSAHKAAGGMTSVYRQIGIGCERLFRLVFVDCCEYTDYSYSEWSYKTKTPSGKVKELKLDGRLLLDEINNEKVKSQVISWMTKYCEILGDVEVPKKGVVFEVRQGYKSKDSKRQNADIDNGTVAWAHGYLPVFSIFSSQIDHDIVLRYKNNRCGVIVGVIDNDPCHSLFDFTKNVLGYDLASFFERNQAGIQKEISSTLEGLLSA